MKKYLLLLTALVAFFTNNAQGVYCNASGNLVVITNYDGGIMNINVDMNIPNLKIGVCTYEAVQINLSGTYVGNVTGVLYAGYNGTNDNCGTGVTNTSINGAPGGATTNIVFYPPSPLANGNGNPNIVCGYSCDLTTNQGGCNTADQVEAYFLQQFSGSSLLFHRIQYNCIANTINLTTGGNCCSQATPLSGIINATSVTCPGLCDGSATAVAAGGQAPYTYQWSGGPATATYSNLCPGTYTVTITDNASAVTTQQVTITAPAAITGNATSTPDNGSCNGSITVTPTGGNGGPYTYLWASCAGNATTATVLGVCTGTCCVTITDAAGCSDTVCQQVYSSIGMEEWMITYATSIYPNPSENGTFTLESFGGKLTEMNVYVTDLTGRKIPYAYSTVSAITSTLVLHANAGVYYVVLETPHGTITKKVVRL